MYYLRIQRPTFIQFTRENSITPKSSYLIVNDKRNVINFFFLMIGTSNIFFHTYALMIMLFFIANLQKMELKSAALALRPIVAATLNTYIPLEILPFSAVATASPIGIIEKLFNIFNSSRIVGCKKFNKGFSGSREQINFSNDNFQTIVNDSNKVVHEWNKICVWLCKLSKIKNLLGFWEDVNPNLLILYKFTVRLSQDNLQILF